MEIRLQPEKEAQLAQIAAQRGLKTDELAQQVLSRYLEDDSHFIEAVESAGFLTSVAFAHSYSQCRLLRRNSGICE